MRYRIIRPVKMDGQDLKRGEIVDINEEIAKDAPWCFEEIPEASTVSEAGKKGKHGDKGMDGKGRRK